MEGYNKFQDAGRLERDYDSPTISSSSKKPKMKTDYPRIKVDSKSFPYLHGKSIGDECEIKVMVKKVAESMPEKYEVDKDNSITLEIIKIAEPKFSNSAYKEIAEESETKTKMEK